MRCQFLREAQVKYCRASAYRKMIVRLAEQTENERCSSKEYIHCPAAKELLEENPSSSHCPFLQENLVQYCAAAAVTKYIPYTESVLSQCGTESHRYCELHLALAQPHEPSADGPAASGHGSSHIFTVDDVKIPEGLSFTPNHMWIDIGSDGICHIGIDAFLAKVLGTIDHVTFVTTKGFHRPSVSLSVNGVDLQFIFPVAMNIVRANTYLRTNPEKIIADPYSVGWLFETTEEKNKKNRMEGLITGKQRSEWMTKEMTRMTEYARLLSSHPDVNGTVLMTDGGQFQSGLALKLNRAELLKLYNEFFSPIPMWNNHS